MRSNGRSGKIGAAFAGIGRVFDAVRLPLGFAVLLAALFGFAFWNLVAGTQATSVSDAIDGLFNPQSPYRVIVTDVRLVRVIPAILLGGALALSGFLLQTFFANPIAGPFILGISSGAQLSMLIICGVMIGYICSAITEFVIRFADDSNIVKLHDWAMGSFANVKWDNVIVIAAVVIPALIVTFFLSKPIGAYQLGEGYAQNMGVNVKAFRVALILLSGILSACVTAFAGPISFVGVAVPHLMRRLFKTEKPLIMIPACFLGGAVFCLICDLIARTAFAPNELSISSVTAVFGAPIVILVMLKRQKEGGR